LDLKLWSQAVWDKLHSANTKSIGMEHGYLMVNQIAKKKDNKEQFVKQEAVNSPSDH